MKRVGVTVAAFVASIFFWTAANAIDTNIGPRWNWSGYYIGMTAGYASAGARWTDEFGFTNGNFSGQGTTLGLTGGRNWQNGRWVYGLEGDLSYTNFFADSSDFFLCFPDCRTQLTSFATLRARMGYLLNPDLLIYGTAGIIVGKFQHGNVVFTSATNTEVGAVVGFGLERKVAQQWTLKAEYLFAPMNGGTACDVSICGLAIENDKFNLHVFRLGLNRHFGGTGNADETSNLPAFSWAGFFVSVFAGYGQGQSEWIDDFFGFNSGRFNGTGALVGLGAGYNWVAGRWVYGLEGDAAITSIKATISQDCLCFPGETQVTNLFTFRGRAGYLVTPNTLAFVTGGVALASLKHTITDIQTGLGIQPGLTVGAGVEIRAFQNWTVKGEYLFAAFGDSEACGLFVCFGSLTSSYMNVHIGRLALNRYF